MIVVQPKVAQILSECAQSAQGFYASREAVLLEVVAMRSKEAEQIE